MINVKIVIASTRPGRKGAPLGKWIFEVAKTNPDFDIEVLDLKEINLPLLDEPNHPRLQKYEQQHTKDWSAKIAPADAFIFVTPEYNFGLPASLKNALDFLFNEWAYKPVAFVSYGGVSGGIRSVQMLKQVVTSLKMMPMVEAVNVPFFTNFIDENGTFIPNEITQKSADIMLKELAKWASGLQIIRNK